MNSFFPVLSFYSLAHIYCCSHMWVTLSTENHCQLLLHIFRQVPFPLFLLQIACVQYLAYICMNSGRLNSTALGSSFGFGSSWSLNGSLVSSQAYLTLCHLQKHTLSLILRHKNIRTSHIAHGKCSFHIEFSGAAHPVTNPWTGFHVQCVFGWMDESVSYPSYNSQ